MKRLIFSTLLLIPFLLSTPLLAITHRIVKVGPNGAGECGGSGCDYSDLNTAIDTENNNAGSHHSNLVSNDEDITFMLWNYAEDNPVSVSGYTANATHTVAVQPESTGTKGIWSTDYWRFEEQASDRYGTAFAFYVPQSYAYLNDLQIKVSLDNNSPMQHIYLLVGDQIQVQRNYLWINIAPTMPSGYQYGSAIAKYGNMSNYAQYVSNSILLGTSEADQYTKPDRAYYAKQQPSGSIYCHNCTIVGEWRNGFRTGPFENLYAYNNIITTYDGNCCTLDVSGGRTNACNCGSCAGTDSLASETFVFVGGWDFHLSADEQAAKGNGYNCHADSSGCGGIAYVDDIDSTDPTDANRPETGDWDIGADEY